MTGSAARPQVEARPRPSLPVGDDLVLALDLGATRTRAAVVAPDGSIASRSERPTPRAASGAELAAGCIQTLREALEAVEPSAGSRITAIGVSAPGPLDPATGTLIDPPNLGPGARSLALADAIAASLDLGVAIDRDTQVALLGEMAYGVARGSTDVVYLTVSTGIGGAVVSDGRRLVGPDGTAGELGHLVVELDGPACGCGAKGHLEAIASGTGIARRATEHGFPQGTTARDVAAAEDAGDPTATLIMDRARRAFAAACVSIADIFDPDLIVVGGSVARAQGERWLRPARDAVVAYAFGAAARRTRVVAATLGDDVGLLGAQPLVAERLGPRNERIHSPVVAAGSAAGSTAATG